MKELAQARLTGAMVERLGVGRLMTSFGAIALLTLLAGACDVHGISEAGTLSTIVVSPNPQTLAINATQQFTAVGADFDGVNVPITPVWSIVSGGGAISSSGMFTAGTVPGTFTSTIKATSGDRTAVATVTVTVGPLASITVTPTPMTLTMGGTQQYVAVGKDAAGNIVQFTPTWSVVANGGSISSGGMFTAGTVSGTFANTVQASSLGLRGTATVTVSPGPLATIFVTPNPVTMGANATQQFTAVGTDANGNFLTIAPVWSVANGGGTIATAGLFTAGGTPGTFVNTVKATVGSISGTATVTVLAGPLATITVSPNPATLLAGTTVQFGAIGRDANGTVVGMTPVWDVVSGGGTIDASSGVFTAGPTAGTFTNTVRATSGSISGFATVIVTVPPPPPVVPVVATITVTPNPVTILANGSQQFAAVARDGNGNILSISPQWTVVNGGGTIDAASGVFTAGSAAGTFTNTVRATSGSVSGFATVIVSTTPVAGVLATVTVTPNPATMGVNGAQQFAAVGRDANGNIVSITPQWAVVNGGGAIDANTGLFTAGGVAGTFTNTVRATSGTVTGFATVIVTALPPVVATVTVTPNPAVMLTNGIQQFAAVGRDAGGNTLPITPLWAVVNGGGTINPVTGLFTAGAVAGTFLNTISASANGVTGFATVTINSVAPAPYIDLGQAALNGIMAGTAVSCTGSASTINANVSISPGNTISGPCIITGVQHLGDPVASVDQIALTAAYNQAAGKFCSASNVISGDLAGTTKPAGVYCAAALALNGVLTLDGGGDPNATFLFQSGSDLIVAGNVLLINGAQAKNVYWQVGSSATLGTASRFKGNILALTSITLVTGTTLEGRALARNGAVSAGTGSVITLP